MKNNLAQNFNIVSLIKFTAPTAIMLVFMSLYQMVDAIFISNFVGENALSAINIVYPIPSIIIAISIMFATGGGAIVAINMGEGKDREAKENFSLIVYTGLLVGLIAVVFGSIFISEIINLLGATEVLYDYCYEYLFIYILFCPLSIIQMLFQTFFVTAGKPHLGLFLTILGGVSNIFFDYLFIVEIPLGMAGAAIGTSIGYAIPAIISILYFAFKRNGTIYLVKPKLRLRVLRNACLNGSSEMVTNLAVAITTFLFNQIMLIYMGESGVAAITIVLYAQFLLTSVFMGFSGGVAPIISYNYGYGNKEQLKSLFKMSMLIISFFSLLMFLISIVFAKPIIMVFTSAESYLFEITYHGFILFAISYLFTGFNIFASSMFTAFSDGKVSAAISFVRTFVFLVISLIFLPMMIGVDGIWLSVPLAEVLSIIVSVRFIFSNKSKYCYL